LYDGKFIAYRQFLPNNQLKLNSISKIVAVAKKVYENCRCLKYFKNIFQMGNLFLKNEKFWCPSLLNNELKRRGRK
jgi:hypothetical protein